MRIARRTTPALLLLVTIAACSGSRPSQDDLASALRAPDSIAPVTSEQAACTAQVLDESDLSDETLRAIAGRDADYRGDDEQQALLTASLSYAQQVCVS